MKALFTDKNDNTPFFMEVVAAHYCPETDELVFEGANDFIVVAPDLGLQKANNLIEALLTTEGLDMREYPVVITKNIPLPRPGYSF